MNRFSKGQSGLENSKNKHDFTYDLGRDKNWEFAFGHFKSKLLFHSSAYHFDNPILNFFASVYNKIGWLFFWWDDNTRVLEKDMKKYYGFACVGDKNI
jgi:hypothetical protein